MKANDGKYGLTAERLKQVLHYDPETGVFTSLDNRGHRNIGQVVGSVKGKGYLGCMIDGHYYRLHRLAWLYVYGEWPSSDLDHIDGVKTANQIANLRLAVQRENSGNMRLYQSNTSGFKGVCFDKNYEEWAAMITVDGRLINIGRYSSKQQAAHEYNKAAIQHFGEFACLNPIGFDKSATPADSVEEK